VIAIFTKADARYNKVVAEVVNQFHGSRRAALMAARERGLEGVKEWIERRVKTLIAITSAFGLRDSARCAGIELQNLQNASQYTDLQTADDKCKEFCNELISRTELLLPTGTLKSLLNIVTTNNINERCAAVFRR